MNKEAWVHPETIVQQFAANEYVAACGDTEYGSYYFTCDAGAGVYHDSILFGCRDKYVWAVYTDSGEKLTGAYGACGATHEAPKDDEFLSGYMDNKYTSEVEHIPVMIWTDHGTNVHCTTNLNRDSWESAKS